MIYLIIVFSFYLEGILSRLISLNYLIPLTSLMSLILIYPYLYNNKKKYFIICFITGILYDITYTNTGILNACLFCLLGYIISILNIYITNNCFNVVILSIITIMIYRIIAYFILIFIDYLEFNINVLISSIIYSLLFNIIFISLMYKITDLISKKRGIYKKD